MNQTKFREVFRAALREGYIDLAHSDADSDYDLTIDAVNEAADRIYDQFLRATVIPPGTGDWGPIDDE